MAATLALVQRVLTALILCLAILLGIAGNASGAFTQPRLENRVGGFGDPFGDYAGFDGLQALEPHREITILCYDPATDVWFYVRQNPWTFFDPLGLETKDQLEEQIEVYNRSEEAVIAGYNKSDMSQAEKDKAIGTVREQYAADRKALQDRIGKIERTARDMAEIYGGAAGDYYGQLDDSHANVQELIGLMEHLDGFGLRGNAVDFAQGDAKGLGIAAAKGLLVDRALRSVKLLRHLKRAKIEFPGKVTDTLSHIRKTGNPPAGFVGGRTFKNHEGKLPKGNYKEYDVDPKPPKGQNRNAERIVIDDDTGRAWYTDDHYQSFTEIK